MMNVEELLAEDRWSGRIDFTIETRHPDLVVARMLVKDAARNAFGTVHAGALIWFADIAGTLCTVGGLGTVSEDGKGFPLRNVGEVVDRAPGRTATAKVMNPDFCPPVEPTLGKDQ